MPIPKELKEKLEQFLQNKSKSINGDWAAVSETDIQDLYTIIDLLIKAKYEQDADADYPINYVIVNRNTQGPINWLPQGYLHKVSNLEELYQENRRRLANLDMATKSVEALNNQLFYFIEKEKK